MTETRYTKAVNRMKESGTDSIYDVLNDMINTYFNPENKENVLTDEEGEEFEAFVEWGASRIKAILANQMMSKIWELE